jgi:hypothetical protein
MDMKTSHIRTLLQKYYEGTTTPGEESELSGYFLQEEIDPEFEADRLHFQALTSIRDEEIPVPEDLELSVLNTLEKVRKQEVHSRRRTLYVITSLAAGLLLLVSTFLFLDRQGGPQPVTDARLAYTESREALEQVAKYFNIGTEKLSGLSRINEAVKPLGELNSLDRVARNLSGLGKISNEQ